MFKEATITHIDPETIFIEICNTCRVVIAQDKGRSVDIPIIISRVNSHLNIPKTFVSQNIRHEILTVVNKNGTYSEGIVFTKEYSD